MKARWDLLLLPACMVSFGLLAATQLLFLRLSLYHDLRFGRMGTTPGIGNYIAVFTDLFYLTSLWLTVEISALVAAVSLLLAWPMAYLLARMSPQRAARCWPWRSPRRSSASSSRYRAHHHLQRGRCVEPMAAGAWRGAASAQPLWLVVGRCG